MSSCGNFEIAFLVLIIVILIIIIVGTSCYYKNNIRDYFSNTKGTGVYSTYSKTLEDLKNNNNIGMPPGILSYRPDQETCETKKNLLVQPNVAFRQDYYDTGCTIIDKRWPEQ